MILSINEHIAARLASNSSLVTKVGNRCYPIASVEEVPFPLIVYTRTGVSPVYDKSGKQVADTTASVYVVSDTYAESLEIAEMVINSLDKKEATYQGYKVVDARLTGASEDYNDRSYVQQLTFTFTIKEN